MKNTQSRIKPIKTWKKIGTTYCLGCKDYTDNFKPQEVKMTNKVLREKSNCLEPNKKQKQFLQVIKICICIVKKIEDKCGLESELEIQSFTDTKTYCAKCRKNTEHLNSKSFKTKNVRLIMQSKCADCGIKKSRFVKEQEAKGSLSNLEIKTPLNETPLLNILF